MPSPIEMQDRKLQRRQLEDKLATEVIEECRSQLMLKFRFLDLALWRMELEPLRVDMRYPIATDGKKVYFDPPRVTARFRAAFAEAIRDYLHMIMHCIFRHPFDEDHPHKEAWWLTCDIITEAAVLDMCGDRFKCEDDKERRSILDELVMEVGSLTPGKLYKFLLDVIASPAAVGALGFNQAKIADMHALFERDNHESWPGNTNELEDAEKKPGEIQEMDDDGENQDDGLQASSDIMDDLDDDLKEQVKRTLNAQHADDAEPESDDNSEEAATDGEEESTADGDDESGGQQTQQPQPQDDSKSEQERQEMEETKKEWEELAKQIEMDIQTFSQEWGDEAGGLIQSLRIANRKKYDYTAFLRQFMTSNEEIKVNLDEFDYVYYTLGMDLYGNMPLIEPLEYKEEHTMKDLVIAIDTSESVSGPLVKQFLEHTFSILKQFESFTQEVHIYIIQCDSRVQAVQYIHNLKEVDKLVENFHVRGFGGTDFRPTFAYVQTLRDTGALQNMKGLIYFTDGLGTFPEKTPDYDAAFVFLDDGDRILPSVPPWAIKVVIDEENIRQLDTEIEE